MKDNIILHLLPDVVDGCAYHRIQIPMINLQGYKLAQSGILDGISDENLKQCELVVFHGHSCISDEVTQIARLKKLGLPYVVDIDDWWILEHGHLLEPVFKQSFAKKLERLVKGAAAVTTTTKRLANKLKKFNSNVVVVPNALDINQEQWAVTDCEDNSFGWIGGMHHVEDVKILSNCLQRIHKGGEIKLALGGYNKNNDVFILFDIWFGAAGKYPHYKRIEGADVYNYGFIYDKIDTCLVPLRGNDFTACKSPLKLIEAGFKSRVCIASDVAPYNDDFANKEVLFVANKYDWYDAVKKMHESKSMQDDYRLALREKVLNEYEIQHVNHIRQQLYTTLINGK